MKRNYGYVLFFLGLLANCMSGYAAQPTPVCAEGDIPKAIKVLQDYDIIATNDSHIATAFAFSGNLLTYSVSAHPKNATNKIKIDAKKGIVTINAEATDNFDVKVTAKNSCGSANAKFNVIIDEEE